MDEMTAVGQPVEYLESLLEILACPLDNSVPLTAVRNAAGEVVALRSGDAEYPVVHNVPCLIPGLGEGAGGDLPLWQAHQSKMWREHQDGDEGVFTPEDDTMGRQVGEIIAGSGGGLCLDVGCGAFAWPAYMAASSACVQWIGVDPFLGDAARRFPFVQGMGEYLPFRREAFDGALYASTIYHLLDPPRSLRRVHSILKPRGKLFVWYTASRSRRKYWIWRGLRALGPEQPVYGLQARGLDGRDAPQTKVEDMASDYIRAMRRVQPQGPYYLGGYSSGGILAFEMAHKLQSEGENVALLALFDTYAPRIAHGKWSQWHPLALMRFSRNVPYWLRDVFQRQDGPRRLLARIRLTIRATWMRLKRETGWLQTEAPVLRMIRNAEGIPEEHRKLILVHLQALDRYRPQVFQGRVTLFRVRGMRLFRTFDADLGWGQLAGRGVEIQIIPGAHYNILEKPDVDVLAAKLKASLARAHATYGPSQPQGE